MDTGLQLLFEYSLSLLYAFFWVIPRRLKFICRRFETLCLFHLHRQVGACRTRLRTCWDIIPQHVLSRVHSTRTYLPMKMEQCSETSAYKLQTPGNHPKESIQHSIQGESLKSSYIVLLLRLFF